MSATELSLNEALVWRNEHGPGPAIPFIECPRHVAIVTRIVGSPDLARLADAIDAVCRRHSALRSLFPRDAAGGPSRRVEDERTVPLSLLDRTWALNDRAGIEAIKEEIDRPFVLSSELPIRASCVATADGGHVLALTAHHIAFDGWSKHLLVRDLSRVCATSTTSSGAPPTSDYRRYVDWQQHALDAGEWEKSRAYWLREFDAWLDRHAEIGAPASILNAEPCRTQFDLDRETATRLRSLARSHNVTLATLMLGLFAVAVSQVTGESNVRFGLPIADRPRSEFESTIGLLMNVLTIRANFGGNPTLADAIGIVRRAFHAAYAHRQIPYELLIRLLGCRHGGAPLPFRMVFNYINVPQPALTIGDVPCSVIPIVPRTPAAADLSLHVNHWPLGLRCTVIAATGSWRDRVAMIERAVRGVVRLSLSSADLPVCGLLTAAHQE